MRKVMVWVSTKLKRLINSRFFLFFVALAIGVSFTISWYEGQAFASSLCFNGCGRVVVYSATLQALPQGESIGSTDGEAENSISPSLEEIGTFTAYTADEAETDSNPEIMASGKKVYKGAIACPIKYAFGTKIVVENMGTFICEDRMAARFREGNYFDILMGDYSDAIQFGRRNLSFDVAS